MSYIGGGANFEEAYKTQIVEKNGIKIGFIAGAENEFGCLYERQNRGGYAWLFHNNIEDNIRKLNYECDFVVVIAHAGVENIEMPIKEWRDKYKRFCDLGVDVIIGHHPHVPQGYENFEGSLIFYSLGNFYFDSVGFQNKTDDSYSVVLEFKENGIKEYNIVYQKKQNSQTCLVDKNKVKFDINQLNSLLNDGYEKRNNEISLKLFRDYYYSYYENALDVMPKDKNIIRKIIWIMKKIFCSNKNKENRNLMLLHNIRIESHRFVVQRALSLISEKKK